MPAVYRAADLFVFLSGFDTFGMVVTEAMAAGLPVIISDKVGARDLIRNGENGFVVAGSDLEYLTNKIIELGRNPDNRSGMGNKARDTALKNSWDAAACAVSEIYVKLLSAKAVN